MFTAVPRPRQHAAQAADPHRGEPAGKSDVAGPPPAPLFMPVAPQRRHHVVVHRPTRLLEALESATRRAVASVYRRCFGLASNLSCPRTVGDRKLFSGAEAPCLRSPTVRCADADGLAAAAGAGRGGFECAGAGLAAVVGSMHDLR